MLCFQAQIKEVYPACRPVFQLEGMFGLAVNVYVIYHSGGTRVQSVELFPDDGVMSEYDWEVQVAAPVKKKVM